MADPWTAAHIEADYIRGHVCEFRDDDGTFNPHATDGKVRRLLSAHWGVHEDLCPEHEDQALRRDWAPRKDQS